MKRPTSEAIGAVLLLAGLASFGTACQASNSPVESDSAELIGGKPVAIGDLPSTVHIAEGCTAAKVGSRFLLTAAHCVYDLATLEPKYGPMHPVKLSRDPATGHTEHAVAKVHVHPAFRERCAQTFCSIAIVAAKVDAPDVAVVELAAELPDVPIAPIGHRSLATGDPVIVVGFGCTAGVRVANDRDVVSLTAAEAKIAPPLSAVHEGSPVTSSDMPVYSGNYALTAGPGADGANSGLCPGDSGGPLYARGAAGEIVVVGVNANYTLLPESSNLIGLPVTNWHTRLDVSSRNEVHSWLAALLAP